MKKTIVSTSLLAYFFIVFMSCKEEVVVEEKEFVARNKDFEGYRNWSLVKKTNEKHASFAATTHLNNEADAWRWIYIKDNASRGADGKYPVGTIVVKEYRKADGTAIETANVFYTAMVKRGKGFNPEYGDWEWFQLDPKSLKIRVAGGGVNAEYRGADLFSNTCNNCHNAAKTNDFVFVK